MPYTSGIWMAKPGKEDEFVEAWGEFAAWTVDEVDGALWAVLTQDNDDKLRFMSFGPWESQEAIDAWREMPEFKEAFGAMKPLIESVEVHTSDAVFEAGGA